MTASAADDDYWRYTLTYNDAKWKTVAETTESNVSIDGTNIISGLTNAKTYFDVTNETAGSLTDDPSLQTKVFSTKMDSAAEAVTAIDGSAITISDKSAAEVDGVITYNFDFKPLDHINKQNYRVLTVRFGGSAPLYDYALIVQGLLSSQTKDGKAAVGIGLGNADAAVGYASSVTTGNTNDWSACGVWYQYYSCTDSYLKLTAKDEYAAVRDKLSSGNFLSITSGGNRPCVTSGVYDYSMLFKVNKRTDDVSNKLLMSARMENDLTWNYALKVVGLSAAQSEPVGNLGSDAISIGLGGVDSDNGNMQKGCNNWTRADAWYKYHININYYTKKVTVGVTNMTTGEEVFTPYVADIDTTANNGKYTKLGTTVRTNVVRYGADYAIDEVRESRDIFVCGGAEVDDSGDTVKATVKLANDVHKGAYNPAYNGTEHEPLVIIASYNADNVLIGVNSVKPTIARTKESTDNLTWQDVEVSVEKKDGYNHAKVFLWKSMGDMMPMCETFVPAPVTE